MIPQGVEKANGEAEKHGKERETAAAKKILAMIAPRKNIFRMRDNPL